MKAVRVDMNRKFGGADELMAHFMKHHQEKVRKTLPTLPLPLVRRFSSVAAITMSGMPVFVAGVSSDTMVYKHDRGF